MACGPLFSPVAADVEINDTFDKAEQLNSAQQGVVLSGTLNVSQNDPADTYKFGPPGGTSIVLNCSVSPGDEIRYTLFDFNQEIINTSGFMAPDGNWFFTHLIGQQVAQYYLMVELEQGGATGAGVYEFQFAFPDQQDGDMPGDAGDDINSAREVSGKVHFNGSVGDEDTADFYSIVCQNGDQVHLTLGITMGLGPGFIKFYGKDKNQLEISPPADPDTEAMIDSMAPEDGIYYFEVYSGEQHEGAGMMYYVNVTTVPKPPPDVEPPTVTIDHPVDASTLDQTTVIITGTASDNREVARVDVSVNGGPLQEADGTLNWAKAMVLSIGQNTILAMATDTAGLNSTDEVTVTVTGTGQTNDTTPPVIAIMTPPEGDAQAVEHIAIHGTASDETGLLRVEVKVGASGTWMVVPGTDEWDISVPLELGANVVYARAVDTSGNTATTQRTLYRLLAPGTDGAAPNVHFTDPVNVTTMRMLTYTVKGTADDETALLKVDVSVNDGPFMLAERAGADWSSWTFDALFVNGTNNLTARAMDTSGNTGFDHITVIASGDLTDTTPPEVTITSHVDGQVVNASSQILTGTAHDALGGSVLRVDVSQNDGPWMPAGGTLDWNFPNLALVEGANVIKVRATDLAANTNTTQITITYNATADLVSPTLVITSPRDKSTTSSDKLDVKGTASDDKMVDRVELTLNGAKMAVTGTTAWRSRVTLKEGINEIVVTAYDSGGNSVNQTITVTYKKPEPPPFIPGFEAAFLVAALLLGAVLLGRRRRA